MDYVLTYSLGNIVVTEGTVNSTATSLQLPGAGLSSWGQFLDQNFVSLLENFAGPTAPPNAIPGQLWYSTGGASPDLKVFNGSTWVSLAGTVFTGPVDRIKDSDETAYVDVDDVPETIVGFTAGVERFRVTSTGELGIGTASPTARVHVESSGGTILRLGAITAPGSEFSFSVTSPDTGEIEWATTGDAELAFVPSPGGAQVAAVSAFKSTSTTGPVRFVVYRGDGSAAEAVRLSSRPSDASWIGGTGSPVGVGEEAPTGSPTAPLHVISATVPQLLVATRTAGSDARLGFEADTAVLKWSLGLDGTTGDLVAKDASDFPVFRVRASDNRVQISGEYYLPGDGGNPGDVITSDGSGGSFWAPLPFSKYYDSGPITQNGSRSYSVAHGFASQPRFVFVSWIALTANNGFATGDEVTVPVCNFQSTAIDGVLHVVWNTTTATVSWVGNVYVVGSTTFAITENPAWAIRIQVIG